MKKIKKILGTTALCTALLGVGTGCSLNFDPTTSSDKDDPVVVCTQTDLDTLNQRLTEKQAELNSVNALLEEAENNVSAKESDIEELKTERDNLLTQINQLQATIEANRTHTWIMPNWKDEYYLDELYSVTPMIDDGQSVISAYGGLNGSRVIFNETNQRYEKYGTMQWTSYDNHFNEDDVVESHTIYVKNLKIGNTFDYVVNVSPTVSIINNELVITLENNAISFNGKEFSMHDSNYTSLPDSRGVLSEAELVRKSSTGVSSFVWTNCETGALGEKIWRFDLSYGFESYEELGLVLETGVQIIDSNGEVYNNCLEDFIISIQLPEIIRG